MRTRQDLILSFAFSASLRETCSYYTQSCKERKGELRTVILITFFLLGCAVSNYTQSSDQSFPTHVTTNDINGVIKPRNIGDARLTTYFYLFEGSQGDIFINVATTNFSGDIDVYAAESMKPLTKMVMFADAGQSETGRLIYLRQPARLLLRIEGRTPNDDPATYRIKFAGSFVALAPETYEAAPTVAKRESVESRKSSESGESKTENPKTEDQTPKTEDPISEDPKPKTEDPTSETVYENKSAKVTVKPAKAPTAKRRTTTARTTKPKPSTQKPKTENPKPPPEPDPLANVKLVVVFKDGTIIERPMTEISRFSFSGGALTVVEKTGAIKRYQIATIAKVTIE